MQDYIFYHNNLNSIDVLKQFASKKTHQIVVSNVNNPCEIQIQLAENVNALNKLMEELELVYCGIGASNYNMPLEYIEHGHLCAAIYPGDMNWHRCRIIGVFPENKKVRVSYVDYGGDSLVDLENVKFLSSEFAYLPVQAVNAKFANIANVNKKKTDWRKDTINYLLNRVTGKILTAEIMGVNDGYLSIEIFDKTTTNNNGCPPNTTINLNQRIVMDGYGQKYEECKDLEVN